MNTTKLIDIIDIQVESCHEFFILFIQKKILPISFSRSAVSQIWRKDNIERKPIYFRCIQSQLWFVKYAKVQQGQSREKETILGKKKVY